MAPFVQDSRPGASFELCAMGALAIGLVFAGSANEEFSTLVAERLMEASAA